MTWRVLLFLWGFLKGWGGLILGGIYALIRGFDELLKITDGLVFRFRDYPVFEVIDTPLPRNPRPRFARPNIVDIDPALLITGYSVKEISATVGRKPKSVLASLKRLKKMGKAVEIFGGWCSRDTAPKQ